MQLQLDPYGATANLPITLPAQNASVAGFNSAASATLYQGTRAPRITKGIVQRVRTAISITIGQGGVGWLVGPSLLQPWNTKGLWIASTSASTGTVITNSGTATRNAWPDLNPQAIFAAPTADSDMRVAYLLGAKFTIVQNSLSAANQAGRLDYGQTYFANPIYGLDGPASLSARPYNRTAIVENIVDDPQLIVAPPPLATAHYVDAALDNVNVQNATSFMGGYVYFVLSGMTPGTTVTFIHEAAYAYYGLSIPQDVELLYDNTTWNCVQACLSNAFAGVRSIEALPGQVIHEEPPALKKIARDAGEMMARDALGGLSSLVSSYLTWDNVKWLFRTAGNLLI
jgi:hypothetical protein